MGLLAGVASCGRCYPHASYQAGDSYVCWPCLLPQEPSAPAAACITSSRWGAWSAVVQAASYGEGRVWDGTAEVHCWESHQCEAHQTWSRYSRCRVEPDFAGAVTLLAEAPRLVSVQGLQLAVTFVAMLQGHQGQGLCRCGARRAVQLTPVDLQALFISQRCALAGVLRHPAAPCAHLTAPHVFGGWWSATGAMVGSLRPWQRVSWRVQADPYPAQYVLAATAAAPLQQHAVLPQMQLHAVVIAGARPRQPCALPVGVECVIAVVAGGACCWLGGGCLHRSHGIDCVVVAPQHPPACNAKHSSTPRRTAKALHGPSIS